MWKLVDKRFSARQDPAKYQSLVWRLGCAITAILKGNRRQREEEAGVEVEALLGSDSPIHREAWCQIKVCYWYAVDHAPLPAWVTLKKITAERVGLYSYVPPLGANIPISMEPLPVDDSVHTEDKIEGAVKRLRNHCSGGGLGYVVQSPEKVAIGGEEEGEGGDRGGGGDDGDQ